MFCPRCRAEYRAGFTLCSDCNIELVDELPVDPPPTRPPRSSEIDHPDPVVIRTYPSVIDANLARTLLDAAGIGSMVRSDNKGGQSPGLAFARGVELLVGVDDVEAAEDVLAIESLDDGNSE